MTSPISFGISLSIILVFARQRQGSGCNCEQGINELVGLNRKQQQQQQNRNRLQNIVSKCVINRGRLTRSNEMANIVYLVPCATTSSTNGTALPVNGSR